MNYRFVPRVSFALLFVVVTWLTLTPNAGDVPQGVSIIRWASSFLFGDTAYYDKIAHFLAYGALGAAFAFAKFTIFGRRFFGALLLAGYGAALEFVQGLMGVRTPDFYDGVANALGAFVAFPFAMLIEHGVQFLRGKPKLV